jgi:hypothetical protein
MRIHYHACGSMLGRCLGSAALALTILVLMASTSLAQVSFEQGNGTGSPPSDLGGYHVRVVTPYVSGLGANRPPSTDFNLKCIFNGTIQFVTGDQNFSAHNYMGTVYEFSGSTESIVLNPKGMTAFGFYVASPGGDAIEVQVEGRSTKSTATSDAVKIEGHNNATFFGFTAQNGETLESVKITVSGNANVQIGEFLINVVE